MEGFPTWPHGLVRIEDNVQGKIGDRVQLPEMGGRHVVETEGNPGK